MIRTSASCFNPRLRTGGDRRVCCRKSNFRRFQSTPPHGRRRVKRSTVLDNLAVSIHASAREATHAVPCPGPRFERFNPRLRTGGDLKANYGGFCAQCFNPRLRTGGDVAVYGNEILSVQFQSTPPHGRRPSVFYGLNPAEYGVSIHASAREATVGLCHNRQRHYCFNPRLRTGGDHGPFVPMLLLRLFQSTPPHGRRRLSSCGTPGR